MTTRTSGASDKSAVNLAVIIGVGVLVLIILVAVIVHSRSSQSGNPAMIIQGDPNGPLLTQKATECKGDFRALSTDDQNKLIAIYGIPGAPIRIADVYRGMHPQ